MFTSTKLSTGNSQLKGDLSGRFPETYSGHIQNRHIQDSLAWTKWLFLASLQEVRGAGGSTSEKGEAKGPEKSIQWVSWLSNTSWKGWESCGRGQDRENKVSQRNNAKSGGGDSGNCSSQCRTGSKCKRKVEGKGRGEVRGG